MLKQLLIQEGEPTKTAFGDDMEDVYKKLVRFPQVFAFGLNCCMPSDIEEFLKQVKKYQKDSSRELKIIVYPNSGQQWVSGQG